MIETPPLPELDADTRPFWESACRGELAIQACGSCGRLRHPPRPMCPYCRSLDVTWQTMSGNATVWSFVVPHPPLLPAFQPYAPYNVCIVALDEDPLIRVVGNLIADAGAPINSVDPTSIVIGEPVQVVFEQVADDVALPRFVRR
ncbi:MAG: Zn-ribbon domain-containing OB-fold protein [Actinomycetes bacterium]